MLFIKKHNEVEDIRVDTRLSILKPLHAKTVTNAYKWLKTDAGVRNVIKGWEAAGIVKAVEDARKNTVNDLIDPFKNMHF